MVRLVVGCGIGFRLEVNKFRRVLRIIVDLVSDGKIETGVRCLPMARLQKQ